MSENITLLELLNLSIGTPQRGSVNFSALYALLLAVLERLGVLDMKTRWTVPSPGHTEPDAAVKVTARDRRPEEVRTDTEWDQQVQSGSEPHKGQDFGGSPRPDSGSAPDREGELGSRIQICEDGVSKAMELIKELTEQKDVLKEKMEELHQQQETAGAEVDRCWLRVDAVDEAVSHLRETLHGHPGPEELSQRVTPDSVTSVLNDPKDTTHQNLSQKVGGSAWDQEIMEAVRNINNLQEKLIELEARTMALEEQKLDQNQLAQLRELIPNKGSQGSWSGLLDQLNQQRDLIQSLMSDRSKLDNLEDMLMDLKSLDRESSSEATSESLDTDSNGLHVLRQQVSYLRKSQDKLEEDVTHVRSKQALMEKRAADQNLQDQLDDLRDKLEGALLSLTSQLSSSVQDEAEQDESESQGVGESAEGSALTSRTGNVGRKLSLLFQHYEQLQDTVNALIQQQSGARTGPLEDRQASRDLALVNDMQKVIPQLQAECEKLQVTSRSLHEDNRLKQRHIEELYRTMKELQEKKADRHMVESEIKADKSALENKVSRLQFDSATEQLNSMFHELLNKVTGQEQDWRQVMDRLSTEMECKLNRMELDSVKKQLEDRWKIIHEKLQAQSAPEHEDAAGLRRQLVERFHCLSCDRPILKQTPGPLLVTLPSFPAFPSSKSTKPYSVEQLRQQSRSLKAGTNRCNFWKANEARKRAELQKSYANMCRQVESVELQRRLENEQSQVHKRISEPTDYPVVPRSCGGSRTNTWTGHRRSGLQHTKLLPQAEADGVSQEFDIIGFDGRIYKGRLNVQALRNTETKLPTIPSKDGMCRTKDKARSSASQRPAASPEVGNITPVHPPSAKSNSCAASSCSGRDWPVSALGCCTSQSSVSQASAAAGSSSDPRSEMNL